MDHSNAVRLKATERYLLNELDPDQLDQFEEHLFDCPDCAVDVRAAAMFLEQSKTVLSEVRGPELVKLPAPARKGWLDWLRPAFAAPVMAVLLAVVGYQNLVTYPRLHQALNTPHVLQWAAVNVGTWGANGPVIPVSPGKGFLLFVRIPPDGGFAHYTADLYNPSGRLEWSLTIPATSTEDQWPVQVPGANRASGIYTLAVHGTSAAGETRDVGRTSFELQVHN